jgi:glutamine cyclotransferase
MRLRALLVLAVSAHGCGGGTPEGPLSGASPLPSAATPIRPVASIPLSGSAASGLAEAGGWLWVTHFESSLLSQVDPRTGAETAVVEVGANAGSVTAIAEELWVGHYTNRPEHARLTSVDPRTARVMARLQPQHLCCEVAGAAGLVWAMDPRGTLLAIDPLRARVVSATTVPVNPAVHIGLVGDERALWLSSDTTALLKIDPTAARVVASLDVGGGIPMTMAHGLVWGASPHHVWAVDPATNEVRVRLELANTIETLSLAVTADVLWVGARRPGSVGVVLRVDLASGRLTGEAAVGLPARVLYAFEDVWVVDWDTNRLLRFD